MDWDDLAALDLDASPQPVVAHLADEGLVEAGATARRLAATRKGRAVLDSLVAALIPRS